MPQATVLDTRLRLREHAHEQGLLFDRVLGQYARERLLARLAATAWGEDLVIRGATALAARLGIPHRRVERLELVHMGGSDPDRAMTAFRRVAGLAEDDLLLDPETLRGELLDPDGPCSRLRIKLFAYLAKAAIPVQMEVTFADAVVPEPELVELPVLPDTRPLTMPVVGFATIAAESLVEIVTRPRRTRRMADYFDLWLATQVDPLEGLEEAVRATFEARGVEVPTGIPDGLSEGFVASEHAQRQWDAFVARGEVGAQVELEAVVGEIRERALVVFGWAAEHPAGSFGTRGSRTTASDRVTDE